MRIPLAATILALSLQAGTAIAAATPDRCVAQEQALRTDAEKACSGLSYLFNPSGCFIARKALDAFDADTCRSTAAPGQTSTEPPPAVTTSVLPPRSNLQEKVSPGAVVPEPDVAQLQAEIARLKAEIARLRAELEQLRGERGTDGGTH
jgi:hypothetical protein